MASLRGSFSKETFVQALDTLGAWAACSVSEATYPCVREGGDEGGVLGSDIFMSLCSCRGAASPWRLN